MHDWFKQGSKCIHYTSEFLITKRNEVTKQYRRAALATLLFKAFAHASKLCSCFLIMIPSHQVAVVLGALDTHNENGSLSC